MELAFSRIGGRSASNSLGFSKSPEVRESLSDSAGQKKRAKKISWSTSPGASSEYMERQLEAMTDGKGRGY